MSQPIRVQYVEAPRGGAAVRLRWGYVAHRDYGTLLNFQKSGQSGSIPDSRIDVFLPDGTIGDAALSHLTIMPSFAAHDNIIHLGDQDAGDDNK